MHERINRRMEALQKQIEAEKAAKAQPTTGLTTTTAVERYHAKREEERKMADFQDTDPASGVPLCWVIRINTRKIDGQPRRGTFNADAFVDAHPCRPLCQWGEDFDRIDCILVQADHAPRVLHEAASVTAWYGRLPNDAVEIRGLGQTLSLNPDGTPAKREDDTTFEWETAADQEARHFFDNFTRAKAAWMALLDNMDCGMPPRSIIIRADGKTIPPSQIAEIRPKE